MDKPQLSLKNLLWYPLETEHAARIARIPSLIIAVYYACRWTIIAAGGLFDQSINGNWPILYAILLILISLGLYRMRREAAIGGFAVYFIALIASLIWDWGGISETITDASILITYFFAIRGTLTYTRLSRNISGITPSKE